MNECMTNPQNANECVKAWKKTSESSVFANFKHLRDRPTNQRTNQRTDMTFYVSARTHLKTASPVRDVIHETLNPNLHIEVTKEKISLEWKIRTYWLLNKTMKSMKSIYEIDYSNFYSFKPVPHNELTLFWPKPVNFMLVKHYIMKFTALHVGCHVLIIWWLSFHVCNDLRNQVVRVPPDSSGTTSYCYYVSDKTVRSQNTILLIIIRTPAHDHSN